MTDLDVAAALKEAGFPEEAERVQLKGQQQGPTPEQREGAAVVAELTRQRIPPFDEPLEAA